MPDLAAARQLFGDALRAHETGDFAAAAGLYQRALQIVPDRVSVLTNLAAALLKLNQPAQALAHAERALALEHDNVEAWVNAGSAQAGIFRFDAALASFDRALALRPDEPNALLNRAQVLARLQRYDAALIDFERVLALQPNNGGAHAACGHVLLAQGRPDEALRHFERAIALDAGHADAYAGRGDAQRQLLLFDAAVDSYSRAIALAPPFAAAYANRGNLHRVMGEQQLALTDLDTAIRLDAASLSSRWLHWLAQLPVIPTSDAQVTASRSAFAREAVDLQRWVGNAELRDIDDAVGAAQPFYLAYQAHNNRELLSTYGKLCAGLMARWREGVKPPAPRRAKTGGKIRVGIVSAYCCDHPVWNAIVKGWVEQIDKSHFELRLYHLGRVVDHETAAAQRHVTALARGGKPLRAWVDLIEGDDNQVLIYPDLGMDTLALKLGSLRLAPVQAASWGHPETTGLPTIDYYLSAADFEPPAAQDAYIEQLITLPHLGVYYDAQPVPHETIDLGALGVQPGRPLLVCAGTPYKYAPAHDRVWVDIAQRLPNAQFLFFAHSAAPALSEKLCARLSAAFARAGLDMARQVILAPWQTKPRFHAILRAADVYLDTIGFSGFNTAMQAVECGLPVVTHDGQFMRGRLASGILKRLQLGELVARDRAAYVECAARLAQDKAYKGAIRGHIEHSRHVLLRDHEAIDGLQAFLRRVAD